MNSEKHKIRSLMPNIKWYALVCCQVPAPFTEAPLSWLSLLLCFFLIYSKPFVKPSSVTTSSNFYFGFSNSLLKLSLMRQLSLQQHPRNHWLCSLYHPQMLPTKRGHISNSESHPYSHAFHSCIILEWYFCLTCIMLMPALFFLANNIPNKTPIGNNNVLITSHAL